MWILLVVGAGGGGGVRFGTLDPNDTSVVISEADIRNTTDVVRRLSEEAKERSERLA
jgi:hypothetical protein